MSVRESIFFCRWKEFGSAGDFALHEGAKVVVCGVEKKKKKKKLHCPFLLFERNHDGATNWCSGRDKRKKKLSESVLLEATRGAHVPRAQSAIPSGFQSTPRDVAALPEVLFL